MDEEAERWVEIGWEDTGGRRVCSGEEEVGGWVREEVWVFGNPFGFEVEVDAEMVRDLRSTPVPIPVPSPSASRSHPY